MENKLNIKRLVVNLIFTALIPVTFFITLYFRENPEAAESYATSVYPFLSGVVNMLTSQTAVSIAEIVVIVFFGIWILYTVTTVFRLIFKENRFKTLLKFLLEVTATVGIIYFAFTLMCGINYYRYPFSEVSGLEIKASSVDELTALFDGIIDELNAISPEIERNADGTMKSGFSSFSDMANAAAEVYNSLQSDYPTLRSGYGQPKAVHFSKYMSYSQITGVFFPFTYEANVNSDVPEFTLPATMCHELTHLRGYMREDEANFIAYLACKKSDSAEFKYSGLMLAFAHTANALYKESPDTYYASYARLDESVKIDLRAKSVYWKQFEGVVAEISDTVNDTYLKINNQSDGTKSYGRMVDLLLAEKRRESTGTDGDGTEIDAENNAVDSENGDSEDNAAADESADSESAEIATEGNEE